MLTLINHLGEFIGYMLAVSVAAIGFAGLIAGLIIRIHRSTLGYRRIFDSLDRPPPDVYVQPEIHIHTGATCPCSHCQMRQQYDHPLPQPLALPAPTAVPLLYDYVPQPLTQAECWGAHNRWGDHAGT